MAQKIQFPQHYRKSFNKWPKFFSSKSENEKKILIFFSKYFNFFNLFLWKRRMQFWKSRRKWVDKTLKNWWSKSECYNQTFFLSKNAISSNWSKGQVKCSFDKPTIFSGRNPKIIYSRSEKLKKTISVFIKKYFRSTWSNRNKGWNSDNSAKVFSIEKLIFFVQFTNMFRELEIFQKNFFFPEVVSLDSRIQFWQPQRIFYRMLILSEKLLFFQLVPTNT